MRSSIVRFLLCAFLSVASAPHATHAQSCSPLTSLPGALAPCLALQQQVAVADLNGDLVPDLAVATTGGLQIELGALDAGNVPSYQAAGTYPIASSAVDIAIADFNTDGAADIAVATRSGGVLVFRGLKTAGVANGAFQPYLSIFTGPTSRIRSADMNDDGIADLVVSGSGTLLIYRGTGSGGQGDGGFAFFRNLGSDGLASGFVIVDLDGDAILDIAVTHYNPSIEIHKGLGSAGHNNGDFQPIVNIPTGFDAAGLASDIASCDFNRDGHMDLVLTGGYMSLLAGAGGLSFTTSVRHFSFSANNIAVGDLNGDGLPDLVLPHANGNDGVMFSAFLNALDGNLPAGGIPVFFEQPRGGFNWGTGVTLADVNRDGGLDILIAGSSSNSLPLFVTHCPGLAGVDGAPDMLSLAPVRPNPAMGMASMRCTLPRAGRMSLVILDASGRRIRGLAAGEFAAGPHEFTWNGRMDSGASVPAGLYWAAFVGEGKRVTNRFTFLR